jgi:hypothetical protein
VPDYRPELGPIPPRMTRLPVDRGYPVPWFVDVIDGTPEFRAASPEKFVRAVRERRCWVCGDPLGRHLAFVIGPMCAVNRTSSEPPCHLDCAVFSAQRCPFLSRPHAKRREDDVVNSDWAGEASIMRNPGVAGVWITGSYTTFKAPGAAQIGYLFEMGEPSAVLWFAEGREATRAEVLASIDSGMPLLEATCDQEPTPARKAEGLAELRRSRVGVERFLPA